DSSRDRPELDPCQSPPPTGWRGFAAGSPSGWTSTGPTSDGSRTSTRLRCRSPSSRDPCSPHSPASPVPRRPETAATRLSESVRKSASPRARDGGAERLGRKSWLFLCEEYFLTPESVPPPKINPGEVPLL